MCDFSTQRAGKVFPVWGRVNSWSHVFVCGQTASCYRSLRDGTAFYYIRNVNSGHPGSITTVHANSAELAFEQLALLIKESDGGAGIDRADILTMLKAGIDVVAQCKRENGTFRLAEVLFTGASKD